MSKFKAKTTIWSENMNWRLKIPGLLLNLSPWKNLTSKKKEAESSAQYFEQAEEIKELRKEVTEAQELSEGSEKSSVQNSGEAETLSDSGSQHAQHEKSARPSDGYEVKGKQMRTVLGTSGEATEAPSNSPVLDSPLPPAAEKPPDAFSIDKVVGEPGSFFKELQQVAESIKRNKDGASSEDDETTVDDGEPLASKEKLEQALAICRQNLDEISGIERVCQGKYSNGDSVLLIFAEKGFTESSLTACPSQVEGIETIVVVPYLLLPLKRESGGSLRALRQISIS